MNYYQQLFDLAVKDTAKILGKDHTAVCARSFLGYICHAVSRYENRLRDGMPKDRADEKLLAFFKELAEDYSLDFKPAQLPTKYDYTDKMQGLHVLNYVKNSDNLLTLLSICQISLDLREGRHVSKRTLKEYEDSLRYWVSSESPL